MSSSITASMSHISLDVERDEMAQSAGSAAKAVQYLPFENDPHADVTFLSADGAAFHLQRKLLEAHTGAFPGAEFATRGEPAPLSERAEVLHLLFPFVYPARRAKPRVETLGFGMLAALAEAAEKYEVYGAMEVCRLQMRSHVAKHPLEVLAHAARHDYPCLIQAAIPHLLRVPTADVIEHLPTSLIGPWVRYRESWDAYFDESIKALLALRIAPPNPSSSSNHAHAIYFARSLTPEICSSCLVAALSTLYQLKDAETLETLREELKGKTRVGAVARVPGCLAAACQYTSVLAGACAGLKAKLDAHPPFETPVGVAGGAAGAGAGAGASPNL